jgi:hypothetical protein
MLNQSHWMYSYKLNTESESLNVQLQTSYWIRGTECTVINFMLNRSHWMYSYKFVTVHSVTLIQDEVCNCTFSDWFRMKFVTVHSVSLIQYEVCNCTFSESLNVQLQTSFWIRVTECTVTNFILNQSHWMYSYKLHTELIQYEVCNCTFTDSDSVWSL